MTVTLVSSMLSWLFYGRSSDGAGEEGSCMRRETGGESERFRRKKKIKRSSVAPFHGPVSFAFAEHQINRQLCKMAGMADHELF